MSTIEYLNISFSPFEKITINDQFYLKGDFFTKLFKIYEKNNRSGVFFQLKDDAYLLKTVNQGYYLNNSDLLDAISLIEEREKIKLEDTEIEICKINEEITINLSIIKKKKKKFF